MILFPVVALHGISERDAGTHLDSSVPPSKEVRVSRPENLLQQEASNGSFPQKKRIRSIDERRLGSGKSFIFTNGRWKRPWPNRGDMHSARGRMFEGEATGTSEVGSMERARSIERGGKHRFTFGRKRRWVNRVEPRKRVARRENA